REDWLSQEISIIEENIRAESKLEDNFGNFETTEWDAVVSASKHYLELELDFIDSLDLAGWQYNDVRPKFRTELLEGRLSFLNVLKSELSPDDD
ncbi:MAG: hypothetical protein AAGA75_28225, partial [Cyanobacteria bacterium P01_E01_bin.6]